MPAMTIDQLNKHVTDTVLPMLKEMVGPAVKDAVEAAVAKNLRPSDTDPNKTAAEEAAALAKQAAQAGAAGTSVLSTPKRDRQKGEALGAVVRALYKGRNDIVASCRELRKNGHPDLAEFMMEQAKFISGEELIGKSMMAGDPDTGGILIPQPVSTEIIDILRARVTIRNLGAVQIPMPSGNYRLPKKVQGSSSYYVGEATAGTTSQVKTGSVLLSFKKQITIVPMSNDLLRFSSPGADQMVRDDIVDGMAVRQDQAFIRDQGTDATPKGIRYWAKTDNVFAATGSTGGTANIDAVTATLGKLILKLIGNNVPMIRPVWLMAPRTYISLMNTRVSATSDYAFKEEMSRGTLMGYPFAFSTNIPINLSDGTNSDCSEIYLIDMADVVIGDSERLVIDASGEAAYEEGGSVKAAFSRDETVIRGISEHDLVLRRDVSAAVANNCRWGA